MNYLRSFLAPRPPCAPSARLRLENLEDRTVPSGTEWLVRLENLPGNTPEEQMQAAEDLFHAAGLADEDVEVVDHATLDGNIVVETPPGVPQAVLESELAGVPGFLDVQPFVGEEEGATGEPEQSGAFEPGADYDPATGANLATGLVGNEPTIAVNPLNPNNIVVAQFNMGVQTLTISLDGGASFPIQRNAVLPAGQTGFSGDDALAFDSQGRLFWTYLTSGGTGGIASLQVNPLTGAVVGGPSVVSSGSLDKEWIAADKNPTSPFVNNLYTTWHDFGQTNAPVRFARSTNQGATWTTLAANISGANEGFTWPSEVTVALNGDVWVAWHTNTGQTNGDVRMRRSTDGGLTFGPEIIPFPAGTAATTNNADNGLASKITGLHVWLQGSMQPRILVDPARPGNIYVVSVDDPDTFTTTNDPSDIVFARSTNNGATWTRTTISQGINGDSEIMPAASIDANGNLAVTWYDNRRHLTVPDSLGGTHYLLDLFATTSLDGGLTFSSPLQVNDPANTFDPERGAPDRFNNHTLRIGEYNGLAVVSGTAHAVWTGNTPTSQKIYYSKFSLDLQVTATTPAAGTVVTTPPTSFMVRVTSPVNPATLAASDFTVNSIPATGFSYVAGTTTITFTYGSSPVTGQGLQTMHISAGAFIRASDGNNVLAFDATFRYDATPLQVVSTSPAVGGTFSALAPATYDVTFNEPIDPTSVQPTDLTLVGIAGASVTGVAVLPGNLTARFTISGLITEGTLTTTIAAGAIADQFGNPGSAFTANYTVEIGTAAYPTPLTPKPPPGSLIYDPGVAAAIGVTGDTDSFTLNVDAAQTISAVVRPTGLAALTLYGGVGNAGINPGALLTVNQISGIGTLLSDPTTPGGLSGLAFDPSSGVFLGSTIRNSGATSQLIRLNPDTGTVLSIVGNITDGVGGPAISIGDLALQPGTNNLFGLRSNADGTGNGGRLYRIDKATGVATLLGNTGAPGGIAFATNGTLYQTAPSALRTLNPNTGAVLTSITLSTFFDGLAVRPTDGLLFAAPGGSSDQVFTINSTNGATTLLGSTAAGGLSDLDFRPPSTTLAPTVEIRDSFNNLLGSASAAAGLNALLQTVAVPAAGTYKVIVSGGLTVGPYTAQLTLNAALENEGIVAGASDDTRGTAQNLTGSFLTQQTPQAAVQRGAVVGQFQGNDDFYSFSLNPGQPVTLGLALSGVTTGPFATRTDVAGFSSPITVTYGDLNGDGRQDMVVANNSASTVSVLLGNGNGTFGAATAFSVGTNPWTVVLGDVNGDGRRDIVTSNIGNNTVSVLLGTGGGNFSAAASYPVGTLPYGVALGDLNADGFADVVTANYSSSNVVVRFGSASGVLGSPATYSVAGNPAAVALGDLNGDLVLDVVTANYGGNSVSVLLGDGLGGLGSPNTFAMGTNPFSIALGDLSGDGKLDVVTANFGSNNASVRLGNGSGGFGAVATYSTGGTGPYRVAIGDVNADGAADIVAANNSGNNAGVLLNSGTGVFGLPLTFASGAGPGGVALADLNGDSLLDMSTANGGTTTVSVWLNASPNVQLQLQDVGGAVVATGVPVVNMRGVINNFISATGGTYFARVFGTGSAGYDLVATRGAAFDTEANDSFATAQGVDGAQGALGGLTGTTAAFTAPAALNNVETNSGNAYPFHLSSQGVLSMRYQQIYSRTEFNQAGIIDAIRFRRASGQGTFTSSPIDVKVTLGYSARSVASASSVFADNIGAGTVTVFDGLMTLSSTAAASSPQAFDVVMDVANLFNYDPALGDLLLDVTVRNAPTSGFLATSVPGQQTATTRIYEFDAEGTSGAVGSGASDTRPYGLITRFDVLSPPNDDWYSVNVTNTVNPIRLETGTPADGTGEFANALNPHIELYDPSGTLVASGVPQVDGRNEAIQYLPLTTGTYRVHVAAEGGTSGEYIWTRNFVPAITNLSISSPINENATATLNGTLSDPDLQDAHTVVINWGPGEGTTTLNLPAGVSSFSASHQYLDDNPSGSSSDSYPISVTVTDNHGATGSGSTSVTVNNVAPTVGTLNSGTIDEGGTFTLNGSFSDPGTQDSHTVLINWGSDEGTTLLNLAAGVTNFTASHPYLDDNPSGTAFDTYAVSVSVTDDDGGVGTGSASVTVNNVAPVVTSLTPAASINENDSFTLTGSFTDPGTLDAHSVVINWGLGEGNTTLNLAAGVSTFSATHQYLDDNPTGTASDTYPTSVTVTDDDGGVDTGSTSVTVNNVAPSNVVLNSGTINENDSFTLTGSFTDPGTQDTHTVLINWGLGEGTTTLNLPVGARSFSAAHQYLDDGATGTASDSYPIAVSVTDYDTGVGTGSSSVTVNNLAPSNVALNSGTINENDSFTLTGSFADIGTLDTHTVVINWGAYDGSTTLNLAAGVYAFSATHQYLDDNPSGTAFDTNTVTVTVTDDDTGSTTNATSVTVNNLAPVVADVMAPTNPVAAGSPSPVHVSSSFTDVGTQDSYTVQWDWGNGFTTTYTLGPLEPKTLSATYAYLAAGVFTITLTVTDDDTGTASKQSGFVVVYDPSAGFVTGGGWIDSPAGAYTADPTLSGKATFGFVSKYHNGTSVPDGNTRFLLHAAGFDFKSTSYEWMVVSGARAQYKGSGMVNGVAGYTFKLTVIDGQRPGGGGVDKFRIKIWDVNGNIVYDNQLGAADGADPVTTLGGGSIQIQN